MTIDVNELNLIYINMEDNYVDFPLQQIKDEHVCYYDYIKCFSKKYSVEEILLFKKKIMSSLDSHLFDISEVLIYLGGDRLKINNSLLRTHIDVFYRSLILNDKNINLDFYYNNIAIDFSELLKSKCLPNYDIETVLGIEATKVEKIILNSLYNQVRFSDEFTDTLIRPNSVEAVVYNFLIKFKKFNQLKNIFNLFFNCLENNNFHNLDARINVNRFLSQYEYYLNLDIYYHVVNRYYFQLKNLYGFDWVKNEFSRYCSLYCVSNIKQFFEEPSIGMLLSNPDVYNVFLFSLSYKYNMSSGHVEFLKCINKDYKNSIFVANRNANGTYSTLFDENIVSTKYIENILNSLDYIKMQETMFLDNLINNNTTA